MVRRQIKVAVPTGITRAKGRGIGLRDVLVTLGIALFILGVVFVFNRGSVPGEGAFVKVSPYTGILPTGPAPTLGSPAPDFEVPLLTGGTFKLSEQRGKVVWINFWATWCPPCRVEMPDIQKVWQEQQGGDLMIIGLDFAESSGTVQKFVDKLGITFPIGLDRDGKVASEYRLAGFPSHFMVDRQGILREIRIGLISEEAMREMLQRLRSY